MAWTYSGDPSTSDRDEARFWLQDTDDTRPLMTDEALDFLLTRFDGMANAPMYVASVAAERLAARFAIEVDTSADGVSVSIGQLQSRYTELAKSLREQWKSDSTPGDYDFAGLMEDALENDPSIPPLLFGTGFMDNAEAGRQDYGSRDPGDTQGNWYLEEWLT